MSAGETSTFPVTKTRGWTLVWWVVVRLADSPLRHPQKPPKKIFKLFWTLDSGCPGSPVRIMPMKVEKTVIAGRPAINRALVHRVPSAAAPARPRCRFENSKRSPFPFQTGNKAQTSSFLFFLPPPPLPPDRPVTFSITKKQQTNHPTWLHSISSLIL